MSKMSPINKGFIATTAVITLACSVIIFEETVLASAVDFADSVTRRERRVQTSLNVESCKSTVELMAIKDYFLSGEVQVPEFECVSQVTRDRVHGTTEITVN